MPYRRLRTGGRADLGTGQGVYHGLADLLASGQAALFMHIFDHLKAPDEHPFDRLPEAAKTWLAESEWLSSGKVHLHVRRIALACIKEVPGDIILVSPWAEDEVDDPA